MEVLVLGNDSAGGRLAMMEKLEHRTKIQSPACSPPEWRNIFWESLAKDVRATLRRSAASILRWRQLQTAPVRGLDAAPLLLQSLTGCRQELARPL
jgi:hypothetical protein